MAINSQLNLLSLLSTSAGGSPTAGTENSGKASTGAALQSKKSEPEFARLFSDARLEGPRPLLTEAGGSKLFDLTGGVISGGGSATKGNNFPLFQRTIPAEDAFSINLTDDSENISEDSVLLNPLLSDDLFSLASDKQFGLNGRTTSETGSTGMTGDDESALAQLTQTVYTKGVSYSSTGFKNGVGAAIGKTNEMAKSGLSALKGALFAKDQLAINGAGKDVSTAAIEAEAKFKSGLGQSEASLFALSGDKRDQLNLRTVMQDGLFQEKLQSLDKTSLDIVGLGKSLVGARTGEEGSAQSVNSALLSNFNGASNSGTSAQGSAVEAVLESRIGEAAQIFKTQLSGEAPQGLNLKQNFTPNLALRIQWMFNQALSSAEILMDPPEMGPLSVKIKQHNGEANVLFQVSNAATKEMLDENLNKLRDMLEQQGIRLGEAQVEEESRSDNSEQSEPRNADTNSESEMAESSGQNVSRITESDQLVDVYS